MPRLLPADLHLPELRLPMLSRDEIDARNAARRDSRLPRWELPQLDLSDIELPRVDLSRVELPKFDLSGIDLPKAITTAAQATGLVARRRSRTPWIVGGGVIALLAVGVAVLLSPPVRPRIASAAARARQRLDERRAAAQGDAAVATDAAAEALETTAEIAADATSVISTDAADATPDPSDGRSVADGVVAIPIEPAAFGDETAQTSTTDVAVNG